MNASGLVAQLTEVALAILLALGLGGWGSQCRAWLKNRG